MVGRMVRFFLGCQREGLAQHRQTHQQQDARHTDAMVARAYVPRLTEIRVGRTPIGANVSILARTGFPLALKQDFLAVPVDRPRTGQFPVCRHYVRWPMTGPNIASFTERRFTRLIGITGRKGCSRQESAPGPAPPSLRVARDPSAKPGADFA